jgi:hypothetical protein
MAVCDYKNLPQKAQKIEKIEKIEKTQKEKTPTIDALTTEAQRTWSIQRFFSLEEITQVTRQSW